MRCHHTFWMFLGSAMLVSAAEPLPKDVIITIPAGDYTPQQVAELIEPATRLKVDTSAVTGTSKFPEQSRLTGWQAVEQIATATASPATLSNGKVTYKAGLMRSPTDIRGPFRFRASDVLLRRDLAQQVTQTDIMIEVAWLPTVNTYRIDGTPMIEKITDNNGKTYRATTGGARTFTNGNIATLTVRPEGIPRDSQTLTITGSVLITLADEILTFTADATGKPIGPPPASGVLAKISSPIVQGKHVHIDVTLTYPKQSAVWESYEIYWARHNRLTIVPTLGPTLTTTEVEYGDRTIRYTFKDLAGKLPAEFTLQYQTPGVMREVRVPFELKTITLP